MNPAQRGLTTHLTEPGPPLSVGVIGHLGSDHGEQRMTDTMPMDSRFIARLGLHGLARLGLPLVVAFVLNASFLLVGRHGSAKTTLVRRLAVALGVTFRLYDASKTPWEDVVGFVDPTSLAEGKARYVPTPLSALGAGLVFIDELSRAEPAMQSRFIELLWGGEPGNRTLMGDPLPELEYVGAGMNPPSYLGAGEVDEAVLSRFDIVLWVPDFTTLSFTDQRAALRAGAGLDGSAPGGPRTPSNGEGHQPELVALIEAARTELMAVGEDSGAFVETYVLAFVRAALAEGIKIDGRRAVMLCRNLLAARAIVAAGWPWDGDLESLHRTIMEASLPHVASDPDFDLGRVRSVHSAAWGMAATPGGSGVFDVLGDGDSTRALREYLRIAPTLSETDHDRATHRWSEELRRASFSARAAPALRNLEILRAMQDRHADFPAELVARSLSSARQLLGLDHDQGEALRELGQEAGGSVDLRLPKDALLARLALRLSSPRLDDSDLGVTPTEASKYLTRLRAGLATDGDLP